VVEKNMDMCLIAIYFAGAMPSDGEQPLLFK